MRVRLGVALLVTVIVLFALPTSAQAFETRSGETITVAADEVVNNGLIIQATQFTLDGTVNGSVIVVASRIESEGERLRISGTSNFAQTADMVLVATGVQPVTNLAQTAARCGCARWACPSSRSAGKASVFSAHTIKNGGAIAWLYAYDMPSFLFSDDSIIPHRERKSEQSSVVFFHQSSYNRGYRPAMWHASA